MSNRNFVQTLLTTGGHLDSLILEVVKKWKYSVTMTHMIIQRPIRNGILTKGWVIEICSRHWHRHQHEVNLRETWGDPDWHIIELVKEWKYTVTITYMITEAPIRNGILTNGWVIEILSGHKNSKK